MNCKIKSKFSRREFMRLAATATAALSVDWIQVNALAAAIEPKKDFPVVVIGGGLGGLSAAAHLAQNGFPVTVVEQHDRPGGYATSFDRDEYTFEVSLHATAGARGGLKESLEGAGVLGKVETVELPELCRIITPDHDMTWPQKDPADIAEQLTQLFPGEAGGIQGFFDEILGVIDEAIKPFDRDSWWDLIRFPMTHKNMWAIRKDTLAQVLDRYTLDPRLRTILSIFWPYYGLPPSKLSGFIYAVATAGFIRFGGHYIKHRSQDLSDALVASIEDSGGQVLLHTEAIDITLKKGTVTGVVLNSGKKLTAKAVISNASVPATLDLLSRNTALKDLPRKATQYSEKINAYRPSISSFLVWLGLNRDIRQTVKGYEIFVTEHYDPERSYQACLACDPGNSGFGVAIYDNAFKGYSQPGTSTVQLLILSGYGPWKPYADDYFAGRKKAYYKFKEKIALALIEKAEQRVIPGLSSMIEVMEAATPLTNVTYTRNPEGAIYGYEQAMNNAYMNRLQNTTPYKGLYLASAWSNPGGGFQPCLDSGALAFRALIKDWGG
ncbi:MAG: NAD(P)/FAD-dependent oxidoreductase [Desulfobacterales bacterium]|jgi:prolycopene isomerase